MLDVVCWKWRPDGPYRSTFTGHHVNVLRNMVRRHYQAPHRFSCITDDATGIDPDVRVLPLPNMLSEIRNPSFRNGPSCYRRLFAFSHTARTFIGDRFVSLDLDVVITGDMRPVWDRPEDFVIWGDSLRSSEKHRGFWYNGSMWLLRAGTRREIWEEFDAHKSPAEAHAAGFKGSDQGWISYRLGKEEAIWTTADGVYSFRSHLEKGARPLPTDARIVIFHGRHDPWDQRVQARSPWIKNHWH